MSRNNWAVTWVPCILRNLIYIYTITEWAEIIRQSYGSHVYWETLYIYIYTKWAEIIGLSHGSHVYWDILYIHIYIYIYIYTEWTEIIGQSYVSCISRHPIYMHLLNEQKKIGQSYGSYVYWNTLYIYIYIYTGWAEIIGGHMGPMYIEILYIYIYIYWVSRNNWTVT